jgi:hypothetical protein
LFITNPQYSFATDAYSVDSGLLFPGKGRISWVGEEISRILLRGKQSEKFPIAKEHNRQKGRGEEHPEPRELFSSPFWVCGGAHYPDEARFR